MSAPDRDRCVDCGRTDRAINRRISGWTICWQCSRARQNHPAPCPGCGQVRVLGIPRGGQVVCSTCAGGPSPFACPRCGDEQNPWGRWCARCTVTDRARELLTDPATGLVHRRLESMFEALTNGPKPATQARWLGQNRLSADLLGRMARGEAPIGHDAFRALPMHRQYLYLRHWMTSLGILGPWEPHLERFTAWLDSDVLPTCNPLHASTIRRYARWQVLRGLQRSSEKGALTQAVANSARLRVRSAVEFLDVLVARGRTIETATQADLDYFLTAAKGYDRTKSLYSFVAWAKKSGTNASLSLPWAPNGPGGVTVSDAQRWADVDLLLHSEDIRLDVRIAGLFTLLFAQPLNRIVAMRVRQIEIADRHVQVTFSDAAIQMPPILDQLLRRHVDSLADSTWLFPGGQPGQHLVTEVFRRRLVEIGIKPHESRKAALFGLAARVPAPILAELVGLTDKNAADWVALAARDWNTYISNRAASTRSKARPQTW